jgi:hypothetical protein
MTLADVARRKPLDTSTGKRSDVADARRSIDTAQKAIADLRDKIQAFQKDELRPRLGDVATAMEGIYTSTSLGSDDEAFQLARELRTMMLQKRHARHRDRRGGVGSRTDDRSADVAPRLAGGLAAVLFVSPRADERRANRRLNGRRSSSNVRSSNGRVNMLIPPSAVRGQCSCGRSQ